MNETEQGTRDIGQTHKYPASYFFCGEREDIGKSMRKRWNEIEKTRTELN